MSLPDNNHDAVELLKRYSIGAHKGGEGADALQYLCWHFDELTNEQRAEITPQVVEGVIRREIEGSAAFLQKEISDRRAGGGGLATGYGVGYDVPTSLNNMVVLGRALGMDVDSLVPRDIAALTTEFRRLCGKDLVKHQLHENGTAGLLLKMHAVASGVPAGMIDKIRTRLQEGGIMD